VGQGGEDVDDEDEFAATFATAGFNPVVTEYEKLIQNLLVPFLDAVNAVGGQVRKQGAYVAEAFGAQREMLEEVAQRQKPASEEEFLLLLVPTQEALARIDEINEGADDLRKHTAMIAGAMTSFGWVTTDEPRAYIGDMLNAVPVYGRQIQADYTGSEHAALVDSLKFLLRGLQVGSSVVGVSRPRIWMFIWSSQHPQVSVPRGGFCPDSIEADMLSLATRMSDAEIPREPPCSPFGF